MAGTKREHSLGIWSLALGYFLFYIPYSGLSKAVTAGLLTGGTPISGFELLPSTVVSTAIAIPLFITIMRWWKHARTRNVLGFNIPFPRLQTFISGVAFATIIATTTLAYSFKGVSIVFALMLMRGGVLILSPLIDRMFHRRVRWFSWLGLVFSLMALLIAFSDVHGYQLSIVAALNLAAYLTGYALRLPCMTQIAKTGEKTVAFGYFVEEQLVAMPCLVLVPAIFALIGRGAIMSQLRFGFTHIFSSSFALFGWTIGILYAGLGIFCTFIYLDRRENTFCIPMYSCSSLLSGIIASWILTWSLGAANPSSMQFSSALLIIAALLVISPLHHLPLYIKQLKNAIAEKRLVLVGFANNTAVKEQSVSRPMAMNFITINFEAVRNILRK